MIIKNLKKIYGDNSVVDNVSFEIEKGKVTTFIGPNGAGKSTVMHMLSRLLKRDGGNVYYGDKDILEYKSEDLSTKISILTQNNNINSKLTIRDIVSFGRFPHCKGNMTDEDEEIVHQAMCSMGIKELEDRYLNELSGGQRQRAFIAMILAQDTEYILLDEPTNSLDIFHSTELMKKIKDAAEIMGKTVVLVLHELNLASYYSDYIVAFKEGKIENIGKVEEVITRENLKKLYNIDFEIIEIKGKPLTIYY